MDSLLCNNTDMSRRRILVAMSGGVDSTVAAYMLVEAGYDIIGMTAKLLPDDCTSASAQCCTAESAHAARRACDKLGIPHHTINLVDEFKEGVVRRFVEGYAGGITPNPCADCNKHIKFDVFFRTAAALNADAVATGHYARVAPAEPRRGARQIAAIEARDVANDVSVPCRLLKGLDSGKDQSYFLAVIPVNRLSQILFPVGELTKARVREIAREFGFANAARAESQDICFTGSRPDFGKLRTDFGLPDAESRAGEIVDESGAVRGRHDGIERFTIGQRRGMKVGMQESKYVYKIDAQTGAVHVGGRNELPIVGALLRKCNWLAPDLLDRSDEFEWMLRYRSKPVRARLELYESVNAKGVSDDAEFSADSLLRFTDPQYFVTPGQLAVAYLDDTVVGCGEIAEAISQ